LFSLALVDGEDDARAEGLDDWDDETLDSLRLAIDRTFTVFQHELRYLSIGHEVDRYLARVAPDRRAEATTILEEAAAYALEHPDLGDTRVAFGLSQHAAAAPSDSVRRLVERTGRATSTFYALRDDYTSLGAEAAVTALLELSRSMENVFGLRELILERVGYPTSSGAGASAAAQSRFYDALLFWLVQGQRKRFPFIAIDALNDLGEEDCDIAVSRVGAPEDSKSALCSLGLKSSDDSPRPAWDTVMDGLALFASP
jgi:hypothetical protein